MDTRRTYLLFAAVVALGLAIGVVLAALWDDGDDDVPFADPTDANAASVVDDRLGVGQGLDPVPARVDLGPQ